MGRRRAGGLRERSAAERRDGVGGNRLRPMSGPRRHILDLPLDAVLRPDLALPLQQVLNLYTVGQFLLAWGDPCRQRSVAAVFDSPLQARQAVATCANWLGGRHTPVMRADLAFAQPWWQADDRASAA